MTRFLPPQRLPRPRWPSPLPPASRQSAPNGYYAGDPDRPRRPRPASSPVPRSGSAAQAPAPPRKANARDGIVCELVAREVGKLPAFRANGADFDAAAREVQRQGEPAYGAGATPVRIKIAARSGKSRIALNLIFLQSSSSGPHLVARAAPI